MKNRHFFLIFLLLGVSFPGWYPEWPYRKLIRSSNACGGDLTNFPLLVTISNDSDLAAYASNNGHDIFFTSENGTSKLAHEIEYYSAGTLIAWINMPVLYAAEPDSNKIYMYYGNTGNTGTREEQFSSWENNYLSVHHMEETGGIYSYDSTVNSNHGTNFGVYSNDIAGKIGSAIYYNGSNSYTRCPKISGISDFSCEALLYYTCPTSPSNTGFIACPGGNSYGFRARLNKGSATGLWLLTGYGTGYYNASGGTSTNTNWYHVTVTGKSGEYFKGYINGAEVLSKNIPGTNIDFSGGSSYTLIGSGNSLTTETFEGIIDELRISRVVRSPNHIQTSASNQLFPFAFRNLGIHEIFPGVLFSSLSPAAAIYAANENSMFILNARVVSGTISAVSINWGDGQIGSYAPGITDISAENFSHVYTARSNFTVTAVVTASSGMSATNSTVISIMPYRLYNPYNIGFSNEPRGCLIKWNIFSSANIGHFNLYRGNVLHERIENPALREYLDENIIFGDHYSYWVEAVYSAGSAFSSTNDSESHAVYRRETVLGSGGGSLATLLAELYARQGALSGTCMISMTILSNRHESFYESGKPVYHQIELTSSDIQDKISGGLSLKFRIPATNGSLCFKPAGISDFTVNGHKDKLFCANWNGNTWTPLSTTVYENRRRNNFSILELETSVNRLGVYGVMYLPQGMRDESITVKNRVFMPGLNDPDRSSVQISFPNPDREQVRIQVCDMNGKLVKESDFTGWLSYWSWDGSGKNGKIAESGLYIISIVVGGKSCDAHKIHAYMIK